MKINKKLNDILIKISSKKTQRLVKDFFNKDIFRYREMVKRVETGFNSGKISKKRMCSIVVKDSNRILKKGEIIEAEVANKLLMRKIKALFREELKYFISRSYLINRGLGKPSGHPGDFELMEMIYDDFSSSKGIGVAGDYYMLNEDGYVEAVRIRKNMMLKRLEAFIKKSSKKSINIMDLGCGSSREIRELLAKKAIEGKRIRFTLIDWDSKALDYSRIELNKVCSAGSINFVFRKEDVSDFYRKPGKYRKIFKKQDLIYSIGLADYIPDLFLGEVIRQCFDLLNEGGVFTIAHKNVKVKKSLASDWSCDWHFYPRDRQDFKRLITNSIKERSFSLTFNTEKTNHIFFVNIHKK